MSQSQTQTLEPSHFLVTFEDNSAGVYKRKVCKNVVEDTCRIKFDTYKFENLVQYITKAQSFFAAKRRNVISFYSSQAA
jgi:hypothetical protein